MLRRATSGGEAAGRAGAPSCRTQWQRADIAVRKIEGRGGACTRKEVPAVRLLGGRAVTVCEVSSGFADSVGVIVEWV